MIDSTLTNALGWALLHFLWQGCAIAAAAWVFLRVFRNAGARYLVAIVAIAAMPLAFGVTAVIGHQSTAPLIPHIDGDVAWHPTGPLTAKPDKSRGLTPAGAQAHRLTLGSSGAERATPSALPSAGSTDPVLEDVPPPVSLRESIAGWLPALVILWLCGVVVLSVRLLGGWSAARRLMHQGTGPAAPEYQRMFDSLVQRLKVRQAVRLLESTIATVPSVVGWIRPVILLPASALTGLTPSQIELLLTHELAHVRRHDYLINLLQCAVETILFYHPAIWWLSQRAREERELCCDDIAVAATGDARQYAEALVALERIRAVPQLAMAATGGTLLPRIRRLVDPDSLGMEIFPRWIAGGLVVSILGLGAAGTGLPKVNSFIKPPEPPIESNAVAVALDTVISHPDPGRPLAERVAWAKSRGAANQKGYYVVHSVRPVQSVKGTFWIGNGVFLSDGQTVFSGSMVNIGGRSSFSGPGTRLMTLFPAQPDQVAIIQSYTGDKLDDAAAVSLVLPYDFHGKPVYWLGGAESPQSVELLRGLTGQAGTSDLREMLVRLIGVHETSDQVVSYLVSVLQGNDASDVRRAAASWLGYHPTRASLTALDNAARRDRSRDVRKEAAEAVGDLKMPEAFPVLVKLARELDVAEVRQEAVEALGDREEADAAKVLGDIALHDRDRDVQREATETLGELSDARGLPVLKDLVVNHPIADVRQEAVETWAEAAPVDQAVDLLDEVIRHDPSQDVRREAVEELIELRDGKGLELVKRLAREHDDADLRREAVEDLPPHMPTDEAIAFLKDVIAKDPSYDVRQEAIETLGDLKDNRAIPVLLDVARNNDHPDLMAEAVETLGEWKSTEAMKAVADIAANHPSARVRSEAVETYGENADGESALALFKRLAATERDEEVLSEIFETAVELKGADGVGFVMEVVKNSRDTYVRDVAAHELKDSDDRRAKALVRELKLDKDD